MSSAAPIITLASDFGSGSSYVAQLKGVLLSIAPGATLIDIDHALPPFDITAAELLLRGTAFAFPYGTTHLIVVDPGVGSARRPIAVRSRGMTFVGPDNGVLGQIINQSDAQVIALTNTALFRTPVSPTFHGRDIFAPVAAELAMGLPWSDAGEPIGDAIASTLAAPEYDEQRVVGHIVAVDRFGNLITNLPARHVDPNWRVLLDGRELARYTTYDAAPPDTLFALVGSDGFIEVALKQASAADKLGQAVGVRVECQCKDP